MLDIHVVDALDHDPVGDAYVTVNQLAGGATDRYGRIAIDGLCPGDAVIDVVHATHEPARRTMAVGAVATVEISLVPVVESIDIVEKAPPPVEMRSTATISGEALERKRGQSLSETIAAVPGVSQLRSGSGAAKPIVRGQSGRRLPLLVDGVRHRSQDWGLDHAPEIDPAIADRITVVRGASGVRYGADAIGGVVLVDPPELLARPGAAGEAHLVGVGNGLGGSLMGRVQAVPAASPLTFQLEGSLKALRAPATPDYPLDNTGQKEWTAGAAAAYRATGATYQLSFRHFRTELGVCTCYRVDSADDFQAQARRQRPIGAELYTSELEIARPYQAVNHELALARARWNVTSLGRVTATYALQYDDRREYDVVRQATRGPQFSFRLVTHDLDVALEHAAVHLGDHHHLIGSLGVVGMAQVHSYGGLPLVPDHRAAAGGAYFIERLLGHDYEIEAGVRYDFLARTASIARTDFLRLVRSGQLTEDACGPLSRSAEAAAACASAYHTLSASLGGNLQVLPGWSAKLDLSLASRPPNPDEQYINGTAPSFPVLGLGRPDIGAETSYSASATAVRAEGRVRGELSVFGSFISDYIYFAPAIGADGQPIFDVLIRGAFPRFHTRAVDAAFWGADGHLTASPGRWLELAVQGSAVRARNLSDDAYLVFVPPDQVRASVTLRRDSLLGLHDLVASFAASYTARQSRFDLAADLAPPPRAYFLAEASLEAQIRLAGQRATVAIAGTNLLGRRYREYASLLRYFVDQPGRRLMVRISLNFSTTKTRP